MGEPRIYRALMSRRGLVPFQVRHKETDLHIQAKNNIEDLCSRWVMEARLAIEGYAARRPGFLESYAPLPEDPLAPPIVREMLAAAEKTGVGPMAAVAGAIAEYVGLRCKQATSGEVIVENGGDAFLSVDGTIVSAVWAGPSPLSGRIGISLNPRSRNIGLCTSSGTVGHSRSLGKADAVTVLSESASLADAAATSVANRIQSERDIGKGLDTLARFAGVLGGVIIKGRQIGAWGEVELQPLTGGDRTRVHMDPEGGKHGGNDTRFGDRSALHTAGRTLHVRAGAGADGDRRQRRGDTPSDGEGQHRL